MNQLETARERVERGAAWLDENVDDWWDKVDLIALDMRSPCRCVLGQLFAGESCSTGFFFVSFEYPNLDLLGLGFDARNGREDQIREDYGFLWAQWKTLIERRRADARA